MKKIILGCGLVAGSLASLAQGKDTIAHDTGYQVGYAIGAYLPFVLLAAFGWVVYRSVKRRGHVKEPD